MFSDDKPSPMIILYNKHVDTILIKIFENCNYYEEIVFLFFSFTKTKKKAHVALILISNVFRSENAKGIKYFKNCNYYEKTVFLFFSLKTKKSHVKIIWHKMSLNQKMPKKYYPQAAVDRSPRNTSNIYKSSQSRLLSSFASLEDGALWK